MQSVDIGKLREIIGSNIKVPEVQLVYEDAFAAGCYLHLAGEKIAGRKLCHTLFRTLDFKKNAAYFSGILDTLEGNERSYATNVGAHHELNSLFPLRE